MRHHAPFALLVTTAAVLSWQPPSARFCRADGFRFFSSAPDTAVASSSGGSNPHEEGSMDDPDVDESYGVRLVPLDVHYDTDETKTSALQSMRQSKRTVVKESKAAQLLQGSATDEHVTLTLIGYKGGSMESQINQDRAFIIPEYSVLVGRSSAQHVSPLVTPNMDEMDDDKENTNPLLQEFLKQPRTLLGVFDGHAPRGELVSEYCMRRLPRLLAERIRSKVQSLQRIFSVKDEIDITTDAFTEVFVELDRTAPADPSGGCTASIILQQGRHIYVANAGDSRSFIVAYRPSTKQATIVYISREDKPNLPDERARVLASGGQVYIPPRGTSRVVFHNPSTGTPTGLAMSRSIGDWAAGEMGVIPDPIVQVLDTDEIVAKVLGSDRPRGAAASSPSSSSAQSYIVDAFGSALNLLQQDSSNKPSAIVDDVFLLGVSATDGLMDYLQPEMIGQAMAMALFDDAGAHPITVAEHLIFEAAEGWQRSKMGRYRDDIAISVSALRRPPLQR